VAVFGEGQRVVGAAGNLPGGQGGEGGDGRASHLSDFGGEYRGDGHGQAAVVFAVGEAKLPPLVAAAQIQLPCRRRRRKSSRRRRRRVGACARDAAVVTTNLDA
jgi:hypothetical protein